MERLEPTEWPHPREDAPEAHATEARARAPASADPEWNYEIEREIGRGGMAIVYLARRRVDGVRVALKALHETHAGSTESRARLAREARTVARLRHPNIVPLVGTTTIPDGRIALVTAYVDGESLRHLLRRRGALSTADAERVLRDIAWALDHAHRLGVVHRDVKPENIFIDRESGRALLADFGSARGGESDAQLTLTGVSIGTPAYMSPEQIDATVVDARSDVYSLGLVGWEMLTGERPWQGAALYALLHKQKHEPLAPLDALRPDVPAGLRYAVEGAVRKDPAVRHASIAEFIAQLDDDPDAVVRRAQIDLAAEEERARATSPEHEPTVAFRRPVDLFASAPTAEDVRGHRWRARSGWIVALIALLAVAFVWTNPVRSRGSAAGRADVVSRSGAVLPEHPAPPHDSGAATRSAESMGAVAPESPARDSAPGIAAATVADSAARAFGAQSQADAARTLRIEPRPTGDAVADRAPAPVSVRTSAAPASSPTPAVVSPAPSVGDASPPPAPAPAPASLALGGAHSCRLDRGSVACWGANDAGQLGDGSTTRRAGAAALASGVSFRALGAGAAHACAVATDGAVYCWGDNEHGQLGDGTTAPRTTPARVRGVQGVRAVVAGAAHSCALLESGAVMCWGENDQGQLGDGTRTDRSVAVRAASGAAFAAIAAGWEHSCALATTGQAFCWGRNDSGQLGDGRTAARARPAPVSGSLTFERIAAGGAHSCALTSAGDAWCWGRNDGGQLGDGSNTTRSSPVKVAGGAHFSSIALGGVHSCGIASEGRALCWGRNIYGQLGDGSTTDRSQPTAVAGGRAWSAIFANGGHSCALTTAGRTLCWGYNLDGQLGDGTRINRTRPSARSDDGE